MDYAKLSLFFTLGVFLEGALLMAYQRTFRRLMFLTLGSTALSALALLIPEDRATQLYAASVIFCLIFTLGTGFLCKRALMKPMTERYVFINCVFIYFILSRGGIDAFMNRVGVVLIASTIFTLFNAFTQHPLTKAKKTFLYIWALFMSTLMMAAEMLPWLLRATPTNDPASFVPLALVLRGMSFCVLFCYIGYSMFLILAGFLHLEKAFTTYKHPESFGNLIKKRFSEEQISRAEAVLILIGSTAVLVANYYLKILPYGTIVSILFIMLPFMSRRSTAK